MSVSSAGKLNAHVEEVLAPCDVLWKQASGLPEQRVLRLAVLRDLIRSMHAERSRLLALSQPERAEALRRIEPRIEALKAEPLDSPALAPLVASEAPRARPPAPSVPPQLDRAVGEGKFARYDRQWEAEIAAEAARIGWQLWSLECWIDIARAESFHHALNQGLWPKGIVLFVESAETSPGQSVWKGRWLVVHSPEQAPHERDLGQLPGAAHTPGPGDWRLVFSGGKP